MRWFKMKETTKAQVGVSWPEALIIVSIVVVNVRHCAANGLWILRSFRGRRVGAFLRASISGRFTRGIK